MEHRTHANPPPKAHAQRLNKRRVCVSAIVLRNQKKNPNKAKKEAFRSASDDTQSSLILSVSFCAVGLASPLLFDPLISSQSPSDHSTDCTFADKS